MVEAILENNDESLVTQDRVLELSITGLSVCQTPCLYSQVLVSPMALVPGALILGGLEQRWKMYDRAINGCVRFQSIG